MRILEAEGRVPVTSVDPSSLLNDDVLSIMAALERYGHETRVVGGAVRDVLRGKAPRDVDLATEAEPDAVMYVLARLGAKVVGKGIAHGTIKGEFQGGEYEVTTLNFHIVDRDGKLMMRGRRSWRADARRRDFTVNAMSMAQDGSVYDYVGGYPDLREQRIRFIRDADEQIRQDPVLVLRFFKLVSMFMEPQYDADAISAVIAHRDLLSTIPEKRIARELGNIERGPNAEATEAIMCQLGLEKWVGPVCGWSGR